MGCLRPRIHTFNHLLKGSVEKPLSNHSSAQEKTNKQTKHPGQWCISTSQAAKVSGSSHKLHCVLLCWRYSMCLVYFPLILLPFCISWVRSDHIIQEIEPAVHSVNFKIQLKYNFKNHTAFCHGVRIRLVNMDNDTVYWSLILEVVWLTLLLYQWLLIWWLHISVRQTSRHIYSLAFIRYRIQLLVDTTASLQIKWQQPIAFRCWCGEGDLLKFNASIRMGKKGVWKI